MLAEFDEGKRSCRKRLDGHNRRRRKPQPHAMHSANLFANFPGLDEEPVQLFIDHLLQLKLYFSIYERLLSNLQDPDSLCTLRFSLLLDRSPTGLQW